MNKLITGHKVKVLIYNAQAVSPVTQHVRSLARQARILVVAVTETMPPSYRSYQAWQLAQARALLRTLGGWVVYARAEVSGNGGVAIALWGATLRFGHHVIWAGPDLDVAPGECLAVLGPNGAGKTTLLKVLLGLLPLSAGTVTIDGRPPRRGSAQIGYLAQQRVFDPDLPIRGRDLVQFGIDGHRRGLPWTRFRNVDAAIAAVGAAAYSVAPVGLLSGGQQQRLRIPPRTCFRRTRYSARSTCGGRA